MKKALVVVGVLAVVAAGAIGVWWWRLQAQAVQWENAKEIYSQSIEKDGKTWHVKIESLIDQPPYIVWEAMKQPERSSEFIDSFQKSELLEESENRKLVKMQIQVLTLPPLAFDAEFHYDEAAKRVTMKSLRSSSQDVNAVYEVVSSPDETKTLVRYRGDVIDKVNVPLGDGVKRGAIQELFVKTIRALHVGIEKAEKEASEAAAKWAQVPEIRSESIERNGKEWRIRFESAVEAPIDAVWKALHEPARWTESSQALQKVEILENTDAKKVLKLRARLLTLPPQTLRVEMTYDEAAKKARVRTIESPLQDLDATYALEASPTGGTLVHYEAIATDRVVVPPPEDVQKGGLRQLFAETIRSLGRLAAAG